MSFSNIRVEGCLGTVRYFKPEQLAELCLRLCGGGWTIKQTSEAMLLQSKLLVKRKAVKDNWTIELLE
jgi:hypothetical protein